MRIVIIGVGEVGFHVAKALSQEEHDITVMDMDPVKCKRATESLDVIVLEGNGASPRNLSMANVQNADYVLSLTRVDEVNLIASQQAHQLGAKKIIAR
ncbi:MAG: NAD-binding protein, partial [Candidatus Neomarinimicrobiota bacterium]|nr:NAD-binding protein [Candidatus Neomarinimicrobiota bacterium]